MSSTKTNPKQAAAFLGITHTLKKTLVSIAPSSAIGQCPLYAQRQPLGSVHSRPNIKHTPKIRDNRVSDILYIPNKPVYSQLRIVDSVHDIALSGSEQCPIKAQSQSGQCQMFAHPEVVNSAQYIRIVYPFCGSNHLNE